MYCSSCSYNKVLYSDNFLTKIAGIRTSVSNQGYLILINLLKRDPLIAASNLQPYDAFLPYSTQLFIGDR